MTPNEIAIQNVQRGLRTENGNSQSFPNAEQMGSFLSHVIYDTVPLAPSSVNSSDRFFTVPFGGSQNGLQKNDIHTNMRNSGQLPSGQDIFVSGMSVAWVLPTALRTVASLQAIDSIMRQSRFRLVTPPREYEIEIPGSLLCAPKAVYAAGAATFPILVGAETSAMMYNFGIDVPLAGINSAPINFYVEHSISDDYGDIAALLPAAGAVPLNNARRQIRLHGTLVRP